MMNMFLADFKVFGVSISLEIVLYIFIGIAGFTFIIYLLNLLFGKNKFKDLNLQDQNLIKRQVLEQNKESLDKEIVSIVKNRKERNK